LSTQCFLKKRLKALLIINKPTFSHVIGKQTYQSHTLPKSPQMSPTLTTITLSIRINPSWSKSMEYIIGGQDGW